MNEQLLLSIIESVKTIKGHYPGKKELQKTIYLLQKKGLPSDYSYRFYFYGPYSDALDEDIQRLTIQGALEIHQDEYTHRITLAKPVRNSVSIDAVELVQDTINDLRTISPAHLELMTTIIFLLDNQMIPGRPSEADVIAKVHDVKENKYRDDEIHQYYQLLKEKSYIH